MLVTERTQAEELAKKIEGTTYVVLDVETHKTDQHYNKELMGVAIGIPTGLTLETYYVLPSVFPRIFEALGTCEWIGHNLKFDLEICYQNGLDFQGPIWDTQILTHLIYENFISYELDWLGNTFFDMRKKSMSIYEKGYEGWNNIPPFIMGPYAEQDLNITWRIFQKFQGLIKELKLEQVWTDSMEYVRSLQLMIRSGIRIDRALVSDLSREAGVRLGELEVQLAALGIRNPGSPKQVREYMYHDLGLKAIAWTKPKGDSAPQPSTDNATIATYCERQPELEEKLGPILEYRTLSKAKTTWYDGFLTRMGDRDYLHPGLKQHGTKTGRLSCAEPNLQQIPRDSARVKRIFLDDEEYYLIEFDYSQIELRVGSWYAKYYGDDTMFKLYESGADVHKNTAEMIGSFEKLSYQEGRYVGKTGNFLWIYQGGPERLQTMLWKEGKIRVTLEQAQEWTRLFHTTYPGFKRANQDAAKQHKKNNYVNMFNGRRRRIRKEQGEDRVKHHIAFNSAVQGAGGQILMYAINELASLQRKGANFRLCNSVHDSLWIYVHEYGLESTVKEITDIMSRPAEDQFELPFPIDIKQYRSYRDN